MSSIKTAELFRLLVKEIDEMDQELIIPKNLCVEFISLCEASDIAILGFDGYRAACGDGALELNLDSIADFSDLKKAIPEFTTYQKKSILRAKELFESDFNDEC